MIQVVEAESANDLWLLAADRLLRDGTSSRSSRNGMNQELLHTVLALSNPRDRWVVSRCPPMNVAFAIAEVIWIFRGRNDSAFLNYFNSYLPRFAGSGEKYHGAYGYRLRFGFDIDQIRRACQALENVPDCRQVVLQIWNPKSDLPNTNGTSVSTDIPCNICSLLKVRDGRLHWTQIMRSNDLFLGLPYNLVQFTTLQELMAGWLGLELGPYTHLSDSLHLYNNDIAHVRLAKRITAPVNVDSLSASFAETETYTQRLESLIDCIVADDSTSDMVISQLEGLTLPNAWRNLAIVLAAEACRRKGAVSLSCEVMESCSNPLLRLLMARWIERVSNSTVENVN